MGARPRRNAADAGAEPPARPHPRAGRRPDEDGPRRRDRRAARRGRIRLRDGTARRRGLHHDAQVPPEHVPGRRRDAGPGAACEVQGPARARRELLLLRRRGSARDHGATRRREVRRPDRPRRPARHAQGHRALEGEGPRLLARVLPAGRVRGRRAAPCRRAGSRPRARARPRADREGQGRDRERRACVVHPAGAQREPDGRRDAVGRDREEARPRRPGRRRGAHPAEGYGRPELRRVPREGRDARPRRRRQRLRRQGPVGRSDHHPSDQRLPWQVRGKHHLRQHGDVRRDRRRSLLPRRRGRALLRAQLGRDGGRRRHGRPRLRIHDGRHGRRARRDGAQLRGRHVGRPRVHLRSGRHVRGEVQQVDGRARAGAAAGRAGTHGRPRALARRHDGRSAAQGARRASFPVHGFAAREVAAGKLGRGAPPVREGVPARIQARAGRDRCEEGGEGSAGRLSDERHSECRARLTAARGSPTRYTEQKSTLWARQPVFWSSNAATRRTKHRSRA
ncbi:putative Uncharacterized 50.6 kDa protein in the 5\\'region of gyrA and gyrB [Burkholderia cenocepacia]|nr:putative Uncharacterized 50.6 kDa protein in the 5\\'region of gyrA and gyrB [Burkholderia cenocepacia]